MEASYICRQFCPIGIHGSQTIFRKPGPKLDRFALEEISFAGRDGHRRKDRSNIPPYRAHLNKTDWEFRQRRLSCQSRKRKTRGKKIHKLGLAEVGHPKLVWTGV